MRVNQTVNTPKITGLDGKVVRVYKQDARRSSVWLESQAGDSYVVKRFEFSVLKQALLRLLHIHPGQCEWRAHTMLKQMDLPALPIDKLGWRAGRCYLLSQPVGPALNNMITRGLFDAPCDRHHLAEQLGQLTGKLLARRLFFRDLKLSNILLSAQNTLVLIDAGSIRRVPARTLPDCVKRMHDLLQITTQIALDHRTDNPPQLSRTDRLRYLTALLAQLDQATGRALCAALKLPRLPHKRHMIKSSTPS